MTIVDPLPLMVCYLEGSQELSSDEVELLLFALYCETKNNKDGLVQRAVKRLAHPPKVAQP